MFFKTVSFALHTRKKSTELVDSSCISNQIKSRSPCAGQPNHAEWYILFQCSPNVCVTLSVLRITLSIFYPFSLCLNFCTYQFGFYIRRHTSNLFIHSLWLQISCLSSCWAKMLCILKMLNVFYVCVWLYRFLFY